MDRSKLETRFVEVKDFQVEERADKAPVLVGYAARYNTLSQDLGGFKERFLPHAFARTLENGPDVIALAQHDDTKVLGRRSAGTLTLEDDPWGLKVEITPPKTSYGLDILESVRRKDIGGMSFAFVAQDEELIKEGDGWVREVRDADLYEVSVVTSPAYLQSKVKVRSEVIEQLEALQKPEPEEYQPSLNMLDKIQIQKQAELAI